MIKKIVIVLIITIAIVIIGLLSYHFYLSRTRLEEITHRPCLEDDEFATSPLLEAYYHSASAAKKFVGKPVLIVVKDKTTKETKFEFQIDDVDVDHHSPPHGGIQLHKCGLYALKRFNFDDESLKALPGYAKEIWKYHYNGEGEKILTLAEKDIKGIDHFFYSDSFSINGTETYIALIRTENHALVIKDLKTMEDKYVITLKELMEKFPTAEGGTMTLGWWDRKTKESISFYCIKGSSFSLNVKTGQVTMFESK